MKVEVKGYKSVRGMDGPAFEASIYIDGKRAAVVFNDGWGGENNYDVLDKEKWGALEVAIQPMTWTSEYSDEVYPMTLDVYLGDLIDEADAKKNAKGGVICLDEVTDNFYVFKAKYDPAKHDEIQRAVTGHHPNLKVMNNTLAMRELA